MAGFAASYAQAATEAAASARSALDGMQASQGLGACVSEAPTSPTQGLALSTINQLGGMWS